MNPENIEVQVASSVKQYLSDIGHAGEVFTLYLFSFPTDKIPLKKELYGVTKTPWFVAYNVTTNYCAILTQEEILELLDRQFFPKKIIKA